MHNRNKQARSRDFFMKKQVPQAHYFASNYCHISSVW